MASLPEARNIISQALDFLGWDSYETRIDKNAWIIIRGSAKGGIFLIENSNGQEEDSCVVVHFDIMKVPMKNTLAFYRHVLELNYGSVHDGVFSINEDNNLCLAVSMKIRDMSALSIGEAIASASGKADHFDDILLDEFGQEYAID